MASRDVEAQPRCKSHQLPLFSACACSSLFYDEDGDLAHEFYEETVVTKNGRKKSKLKRIQKNLIPQVGTSGLHCWSSKKQKTKMTVLLFFFLLPGRREARPSLYSRGFSHHPL